MTVFLDSCALIYWLEGREPWRAKVVATLRALHEQADSNAELCISRLAVLECLVKPLRDDDQRAEAAYRHFFAGDDLRIVELKPQVVEHATHLRATYHLRTPDALQAASALSVDDDIVFVTNDDGFARVPNLKTHILH